jgi:hypothetical protein
MYVNAPAPNVRQLSQNLISLKIPDFGERKAQSSDIAWYQQLTTVERKTPHAQ